MVEPVGLAHDYLLVMRGAERAFKAMTTLWPEAPIYTLLYDRDGTEGVFDEREIRTSALQRLGVRQRGFRRLLPLFPSAVRRMAVEPHELLISSSSAFAHGLRAGPDTTHVCYCHSPFRYAWHERERALAEVAAPARPALAAALAGIKRWDRRAAGRVTHYIANSEITRQRIAAFYGRDAVVVHPPVEVERFTPGSPQAYLLVVTELVPHKRVDLALAAARRAGRPIKIVGDGPQLEALRAEFAGAAEFLGRVSDAALPGIYAGALALVVPNVEEFGIAAVEAMASGRPVVAAAGGGALETVVEHETGLLVPPGDVESLADALRSLDDAPFDPARIRAHAERFSMDAFQARLGEELERLGAVSG